MDRQRGTRQIERIVKAIEDGKFPAKVLSLHVFGSYARGALNPDDLDLILIHEPVVELLATFKEEVIAKYGRNLLNWPRGQFPSVRFETMMRKVMRLPGEKMDIILGTSLDEVTKEFDKIADAPKLLVWSKSDRNWRQKLDAIQPDPEAGRYERHHFANLKRFDGTLDMMESVSKAISLGFLKLTRLDADKAEPRLNSFYQHLYAIWEKRDPAAKQSNRTLLYALWWMQKQRGQSGSHPRPLRYNGPLCSEDRRYAVSFGKPSLHDVLRVVQKKDRMLRVCLIPLFKRGAANELFIFEKGKRTDQKALAEILYT